MQTFLLKEEMKRDTQNKKVESKRTGQPTFHLFCASLHALRFKIFHSAICGAYSDCKTHPEYLPSSSVVSSF